MTSIHTTALIGPNVTIEDDVYIGPYCIIGFPPEWKGKETQDKGVHIGRGTRITGHVTIDAGAEQCTMIGPYSYLMKHAHVGHDAQLGEQVTVSCGAKIGGHAVIDRYCNIGLNAVIHQKQHIAEGCMIGMGSVVTKKLQTEPFKKYAGNPAKYIGENDCHPFYTIDSCEY